MKSATTKELEALHKAANELFDGYDEDDKAAGLGEKRPDIKSVEDAMRWLRDEAWDLWSCVRWLAPMLDHLEKDRIEHGSCQNYDMRLCAQLAFYYINDLEVFNDWST
jgi:hypothetical protein